MWCLGTWLSRWYWWWRDGWTRWFWTSYPALMILCNILIQNKTEWVVHHTSISQPVDILVKRGCGCWTFPWVEKRWPKIYGGEIYWGLQNARTLQLAQEVSSVLQDRRWSVHIAQFPVCLFLLVVFVCLFCFFGCCQEEGTGPDRYLFQTRLVFFCSLFVQRTAGFLGHHQPCMHKPELISCPHVTYTYLRTFSCDFSQNSLLLLQSSTVSPSCTVGGPRPYTLVRNTKPEHCEALHMCSSRRCKLGFPTPASYLKPDRARLPPYQP